MVSPGFDIAASKRRNPPVHYLSPATHRTRFDFAKPDSSHTVRGFRGKFTRRFSRIIKYYKMGQYRYIRKIIIIPDI
jgi:hypothetical protein